jgi:hypothetical protein
LVVNQANHCSRKGTNIRGQSGPAVVVVVGQRWD